VAAAGQLQSCHDHRCFLISHNPKIELIDESSVLPYTNHTQTLLFPCRRNINFCLIRTLLNRQKLHISRQCKYQMEETSDSVLHICLKIDVFMLCEQNRWMKRICLIRSRGLTVINDSVMLRCGDFQGMLTQISAGLKTIICMSCRQWRANQKGRC